MGTYSSVYVGVYLEIPYKKDVKVESHYVHPETGKKQKNKFDGETGRENIKKRFEKEVDIVPMSYIYDDGYDEDMFFTPEYTGGKRIQTFILNSNTEFSEVIDEVSNINLVDKNIPELIEQFTIKYKKYLDYYIKLYDTVDIKYGVVYYAH